MNSMMKNVAVVPNSSYRVEYAVKLPGNDGTVYLPIDAKFPGDTYNALRGWLVKVQGIN